MTTYTHNGVRLDVTDEAAQVSGYGPLQHDVERCRFIGDRARQIEGLEHLVKAYRESGEDEVADALEEVLARFKRPGLNWHRIRSGQYVSVDRGTRYEVFKTGRRAWVLTIQRERGGEAKTVACTETKRAACKAAEVL